MMAAEIVQLSEKVLGETGEFDQNGQTQDAELSVQIALTELRIKHLNIVLASIKSITLSCGTGVK